METETVSYRAEGVFAEVCRAVSAVFFIVLWVWMAAELTPAGIVLVGNPVLAFGVAAFFCAVPIAILWGLAWYNNVTRIVCGVVMILGAMALI